MNIRPYITTFTGTKFYWDDVETNEYDIRDIAHALSLSCRWAGHVRRFYSVAQHSVLVASEVPQSSKLGALMHDAAEAYVHDTPSPLKRYLYSKGFNAFAQLEETIEQSIFKTFGISWPYSACVKEADLRMLATEHRDLMPDTPEDRAFMPEPYLWKVEPLPPEQAERLFLNTFNVLVQEGTNL